MDKVQKIRKEIERLFNHVKDSNFESDSGAFYYLKDLLDFIDSLQEEPVSNPIDFEKELYKAFGQVKDFTLGMQIAKLFYDMGKNSQESVSQKKCIFTKDSYTDEDRKVLCEDCKEKCEYSKKEEHVSEDVVSVAKQYVDSHVFGNEEDKFTRSVLVDMFCSGAQWQKDKFEKNRLAACDRQTEEEADVERDFVMGIIEKEHRQPTFDDAIKYGYHQAEKDIKEEFSKLFREFMMDCVNDSTDTHILHFVEVFNNKIKTIGNE